MAKLFKASGVKTEQIVINKKSIYSIGIDSMLNFRENTIQRPASVTLAIGFMYTEGAFEGAATTG
jgi:hypothetical protein